MRCHECTDGWDHCHEVLIDHAGGGPECAGDVACAATADRHGWVVACVELVPPCRCGAADEAAA